MEKKEKEIYDKGFKAGLEAYAWWKDGIQYVGTSGTTLKQALEKLEEIWNYEGDSL